jgi:Na+/proline symporter
VDWWFFGILTATTATFALYGYWGGIVAAIRTDMVQGWMIILLSFLAIPMAMNMPEVGGVAGLRETLAGASGPARDYLSLFDTSSFKLSAVILLCINGPLTALALPHLMSVCAAGETEWEGRMGFAGGNMLKRICTIGWSLLGLCWLAYLLKTGASIHPDAAFGDSIRALLPPFLQGIMLSCVMAASMSSGDAFQVTVAGLFTQSLYRPFVNPLADEGRQMRVTRLTGLVIVGISFVFAILMRDDVVKSIIAYFNILSIIGISAAMGIVWRRMNTKGVFASALLSGAVFVATRYAWPGCPAEAKFGLPILAGVIGGLIGSLVTAPPDPTVIEAFFKKIYTPIGQEAKLDLSLDEAVPEETRLLTAGGLFLVKPARQSWVGFLLLLAACVACVLFMALLLKA